MDVIKHSRHQTLLSYIEHSINIHETPLTCITPDYLTTYY